MGHRLIKALLQEKSVSQVAARLGEARPHQERVPEMHDGHIKIALALAGQHAEQLVCFGMARINMDDLPAQLLRLAQVPCQLMLDGKGKSFGNLHGLNVQH
jgi:hypothetical protein